MTDLRANGFLGLAEVAALFGVTKQTVGRWRHTHEFPQPRFTLSATPVWHRSDLVLWAKATDRRINY